MRNYMDNGQTINININELIQKARSGSIQNKDFTKIWCDVSLLLASRIEYVIRMSQHRQKGYNKDEAVIYGQLVRIFKMLCFQRRLVCKQIMTTTLAAFFERTILEGNMGLQYFIKNYKGTLLNDFRLNSLKAEAFFEEAINSDVAENGGRVSTWQEQLLKSIRDTYKKLGVPMRKLEQPK